MKVTLSFDNGPDPETTVAVLDALATRSALATFFVVGRQLQQPAAREVAARAVAEGHWIGNHTMTHSRPFGDRDDPGDPEAEIGATQELIGDLAHADRLFRPYGQGGVLDGRLLSPEAVRYLEEGRYSCVLWNSVPRDWEYPDGWVDRAMAVVAIEDWSVVVLHDLATGAMRHLPEFLDRLAGAGAEVVQDFPDSCVPIRRGRVHAPMGHLMP